ncbi:MAG: DUF4097 family beta strand repeat-containing protein [Halanaerobiales bacterium]
MNKKIIYYLVLVAVCSIGLGLAIIYTTGGLVFSETNQNYDINITEVRESDGVNQITVNNISADITIIPEERENIKIHYYGNVSNTADIPELNISRDGNELIIRMEEGENKIRLFYFLNLTLEIHIPEEYAENLSIASSSGNIDFKDILRLRDFSLDSLSGNLYIDTLTAGNTDIKLKSGNLKAVDLQVEDMAVEVISGNIDFNDFKANDCNFSLTSGNLNADTFHTERTEYKIISGDVKIEDFYGDLRGETSSGNIRIKFNTFKDNVRLSSSSGNIVLDLPDDAEFSIDARTSGNIYYNFPVSIQGIKEDNYLNGHVSNGENTLKINVSSGNITIE